MIYFDNAATTPVCTRVKEHMKFLIDEYANPSSQYAPAKLNYQRLYDAEKDILQLLNADPKEYNVYFTSGATESNNWALRSFAHKHNNKCAIIAPQTEHPSVHNTILDLYTRDGVRYRFVNSYGDGSIDLVDFVDACCERPHIPKMVSVMAVNNQLGTKQPIDYIGNVCEDIFGAEKVFHVDATQALGHMEIDMSDGIIDMLSGSAHKFGGLKGVGFLVCKKNLCIIPMIVGGKQNKNKRAGTENVLGIATTATALKDSYSNFEEKQKKICALRERILNGLTEDSYYLNGSIDGVPHIINISLKNISGYRAALFLEANHIYVSTTSACESDEAETTQNRVLQACGYDDERIKGAIRISLSHLNTEEECDKLVEVINQINGVV